MKEKIEYSLLIVGVCMVIVGHWAERQRTDKC